MPALIRTLAESPATTIALVGLLAALVHRILRNKRELRTLRQAASEAEQEQVRLVAERDELQAQHDRLKRQLGEA